MNQAAYRFTPCPAHPGRNIYNHPCEVCGYTQAVPESVKPEPALRLVESQERGDDMPLVAASNPQVDLDTGELNGQLMLGIYVPRVAVQRKADLVMGVDSFNARTWEFREGDKLTATMKDGNIVVRLTSAWEATS